MPSTLREFAHRRTRTPTGSAQRCDLCSDELADQHRHVLNTETGALSCACPACGVLFDHHAAGGGHYRLIRSRPRLLAEFELDDVQWASFGIPVGLAFFVHRDADDRVTAFYPNPVGTMRSDVDADSWRRLVAANPRLSAMDSDVEALLIDRLHDVTSAWLLPLDECYRLVALLRTHWRGFSGGSEVWRQVDEYFARLREGGSRGGTHDRSR
ncbi:DUF5947 family protein [Saccharopolyspora oryzae]|uniref:DUF5947 family protein n=1 Tax=Saccharopolyspora oryzae TaxID=2997343 RepID=A0ABT4UU31_9PSEU|nr:DUF5947 family protein [Saccharopolyspora oryzae]MDA3625215.1 DUF5947 family protein [Saccharopolyspora oryzae]